MNNFNWKPFAVVAALIAVLFVIGIGLMAFSPLIVGGGPGMMGWGMGGMGFFWIFLLFGLVMMFFFISLVTSRGGPMGWMFGNWPRDAQSGPPFSAGQSVCPSCGSPVQQDWNVCPHCGTSLKK
jgi:hypothetical protein